MTAAMAGKAGCVQLLLQEMGADPDVATASKRETALHLAAFSGHYEVLSLSVSLSLSLTLTLTLTLTLSLTLALALALTRSRSRSLSLSLGGPCAPRRRRQRRVGQRVQRDGRAVGARGEQGQGHRWAAHTISIDQGINAVSIGQVKPYNVDMSNFVCAFMNVNSLFIIIH